MSSSGDLYSAKCSACGGLAEFKPVTGSLVCIHCGAESKIENTAVEIKDIHFEEFIGKLKNSQTAFPTQTLRSIRCKSCGAETTFPDKVSSRECAYCGTPMVLSESVQENTLAPQYLLPFKVPSSQAIQKFQKWVNALWFAPDDLKNIAFHTTEKLKGIYVPHWTFDFQTTTDYFGKRGEYYYENITYNDSRGVAQVKKVRKTLWSPPLQGTVRCNFDDILVCASGTIPPPLKNHLKNWDKSNLQPVRPEYLAGFITEIYSIPPEEGLRIAKESVQPAIDSEICRQIGGDEQEIISKKTTYDSITFKYILLPVWISAYKYKNRTYRFVVNARTGSVYGERPCSVPKILLLILTIALVIWILVLVRN